LATTRPTRLESRPGCRSAGRGCLLSLNPEPGLRAYCHGGRKSNITVPPSKAGITVGRDRASRRARACISRSTWPQWRQLRSPPLVPSSIRTRRGEDWGAAGGSPKSPKSTADRRVDKTRTRTSILLVNVRRAGHPIAYWYHSNRRRSTCDEIGRSENKLPPVLASSLLASASIMRP
jgi:hypothetical protein